MVPFSFCSVDFLILPEGAAYCPSRRVLLLAVPNVSEGRDESTLDAIGAAYGPALERGRFPVGVVHVEIDSKQVDVNVNPDEPPLPGKVEYNQAVKFAEAFLRGQPRKATIATTLFKDKIEQLRA